MAYQAPELTPEESARFMELTHKYIEVSGKLRAGVAPQHVKRGETLLEEYDKEQNNILTTAINRKNGTNQL